MRFYSLDILSSVFRRVCLLAVRVFSVEKSVFCLNPRDKKRAQVPVPSTDLPRDRKEFF